MKRAQDRARSWSSISPQCAEEQPCTQRSPFLRAVLVGSSSPRSPYAVSKRLPCDIGPEMAGTSSHQACGSAASSRWNGSMYAGRSEEHTSELQSLMRISYAVLCLKNNMTQT